MTFQSFERTLKQPSQVWIVLLLGLIGLLLVSGRLYAAPPTMEFFAAGGNTAAQGPVLTPQVNTYSYNPNNPTDNAVVSAFPALTVTYTLENQVYTSATLASNGLVFGDSVAPQNIYIPLSGQGSPANTDFSSNRLNPANPQGIDITANHGQRMALNTSRLNGNSIRNTTAVNGGLGYYYGDIVMTWNRPVLNPVINVSGLGGRVNTAPAFGFAAQFELSNPPAGTSMSLLSGRNTAVSGLTIRNNATSIGSTAAAGGSSGSIQILNTNPITSLRFRAYVRTDYTTDTTNTNWGTNTGDALLFSSSSVDAVVGDLFVSKTNSITSVTSGGSTTYTVRVTNNGPSTIDGAILNDVVGTGLSATSVICSAAASNRCTTAPNLASLVGSGVTLPSLASGEFYEVSVSANVTASSGSVINSAQISLPASNIASNTGASCVTSGGITRSFNSTTGACTSTDTDSIVSADLSITKTNSVSNVSPAGTTAYTVVVNNAGPSAANNALFQDAAATGLSKTSITCAASGGAVCPTAPIDISVVEGAAGIAIPTLPSGGSVTFTINANVTASGGNVTNTATITAPNGVVEINTANNSASDTDTVSIVIDPNGTATDQCSASNAVNVITPTQDARFENATTITNIIPVSAINTAQTYFGTGPDGRLQVVAQLGWSQGNPQASRTSSTLSIEVNGTRYALMTTRPAGQATNSLNGTITAANGATISINGGAFASSVTIVGGTSGTAGSVLRNVVINLPASISAATSLQSVFVGGAGSAADDIAYNYQTINQCKNRVTLIKALGGNRASNTDQFAMTIAGQNGPASTTTTGTGSTVSTGSTTLFKVRGSTAYTLSELMAAGSTSTLANYATTYTCTNASTGTTTVLPAANSAGQSFALTPQAGDDITCTMTNRLTADLSVTKTNSVTALNAGSSTAYTVVVSNAGPSPANNAVFQDAAATGLTKTSISCSATGGAVCPTSPTVAQVEAGLVIATLPSGGSVTFTINANVTATSGSVANTATVTAPAGTTEINTANNTATDTDTVTSNADLSISKTNSVSAVDAGSTTSYTVVVSNAGPSAANNALFRDVAATGLSKTTITCTATGGAVCPTAPISVATVEGATGIAIPTLPSGGSVTFTVNATVTAITGSVSNVATVTAPAGTTEIDPANNTATDTDTVTPAVDLSVLKSQRAGTSGAFQTSTVSVLVLGTVQYQLVLTNNGPSSVTAATLSDSVPAQFNTVSVVSATGANGATACSASNTGNNVSGTWSGPSGATCTVLIQATAGLTTGTFTNTASTAVPSGTVETNNANNSSSVQTAIAAAADLAIVKTQRSGTSGTFVSTPLTVNQLQTVQYQLVLTNNGPTTANGATYTDSIPANITGLTVVGTPSTTGVGTVCATPSFSGQTLSGTFTAAQNGTCTVVVQGTASTTGSITNTATITAVGVTDTVAGNNSSSVDMTIILAADLSITKTNSVSAVDAGSTTAYSVVVTNAGPSAANNALFRDVAATGLSKTTITCTATGGAVCPTAPISVATVEGATGIAIPTLPSGGSVTFTVNANVTAITGSVSNVATVTAPAGVTEINTANNTATDTDTVNPRADLSISKTNSVSAFDAGSTTAYSVVVTNAGPSAADNAVFQDAAATGLSKTSVSCTATGGAVCPSSPTVAQVEAGLAIPTLPSGGSVTFTVNANVTANSGSVANIATVTAPAGVTEINTANNTATDTDTVNPRADLSITKTNSVSAVDAGSTTAYSVVVTNAGPSAANNALFRDVAATGLSKTTITCTATGGAVCPTAPISVATVEGATGIAIPTLPSGGSVTFTVNANVTAITGSVSNVATVTAPAGVTEINTANNTASDTDTVTPRADLSITKTNSATTVSPAGTTAYTVVVTNAGPSAANGALFGDLAATGLSKTSITCTASGGAVCPTAPIDIAVVEGVSGIAIPTLPSGGSVTFTINANVTAATGSVTNTATITAPAGVTEINAANNSASDTDTVTVVVDPGGASTDQCLASNAVNVITPTQDARFENATTITNTIPVSATNSAQTYFGTGPDGRLQVVAQLGWSQGNPQASRTSSTLSIEVNGTRYALLTTRPAGQATNSLNGTITAANGATISINGGAFASSVTIVGGTSGTAGSVLRNVVINLPASISAATSLQSVFVGGSGAAADDIAYNYQTINQCKNRVTLIKALGGNRASNTDQFAMTIAGQNGPASTTTTGTGSTVSTGSTTLFKVRGSTAYTLSELMAAGSASALTNYATSYTCTNSSTGTTTVLPAVNSTGQSFVLTPQAGDEITCTMTNSQQADLSITKTNGVAAVDAGNSTAYTIVATNAGPSAANNALFRDVAAAGLTKTSITCSATGGAVCPTAPISVATVEGATGIAIPTLPSGASVTFTVNANVTATSGSVANTATITAPAGVTEINSANNTATDTDTVTPNADLSISKTNSVTAVDTGSSTAYSIVVSNAGPSAANNALFRDVAAAGLTKTSITCSATGGAVCPTAPISIATVEGATGIAIPTLPSGGSVTLIVTANVTASSGNVTNTATVTAPAGVTEINTANNTASDTDSVNALVNITGRLFNDNSGTTAIAANAYNGLQNTGELGIAGSTVQLNNCAGTVIATTQTDGAGDYSFGVLLPALSTPNFCITQTNLAGYSSVSGTAGYVRGTDTITLINTAVLSYTGHNFGDARLNLTLTTDGQQTTTPSGTVSYPHLLRSESVLDVGLLNTVTSESPILGWTSVLYRDNNCNGTVDGGESTLTGAIGQLLPNQDICVVQRVNAPANASNGAQHVATLSASYTATVQDTAVLSGSSNSRTDTTLVGTAGLDMRKQVRVVASCPSTGADVTAFTDRNTAKNGDFLEYEIIYSNRSTRNLSEVKVRDFVPSKALFKTASCQATAAGSSCTVNSQPAVNGTGEISWLISGAVAPSATGRVRFCVQVPPLAEPPIQ